VPWRSGHQLLLAGALIALAAKVQEGGDTDLRSPGADGDEGIDHPLVPGEARRLGLSAPVGRELNYFEACSPPQPLGHGVSTLGTVP
jgi:hypothetical protein